VERPSLTVGVLQTANAFGLWNCVRSS